MAIPDSSHHRTLLDIMKEDESGTAYKDLVERYSSHNTKHRHRKSIHSIKDRIRNINIRRSKSPSPPSSPSSPPASFYTTTSPQPVPASDIPPLPSAARKFSRTQSSCSSLLSSSISLRSLSTAHRNDADINIPRVGELDPDEAVVIPPTQEEAEDAVVIPPADVVEEEEEDEDEDEERKEDEESGSEEEDKGGSLNLNNITPQAEPPPVKSLLALLEETSGLTGSTYLTTEEEEEEEEVAEEEEEEEEERGSGQYKCCVCMVRHKGAAFIPCGHTFCRRCSKELWGSRGNCPLCNSYIQEILHIF